MAWIEETVTDVSDEYILSKIPHGGILSDDEDVSECEDGDFVDDSSDEEWSFGSESSDDDWPPPGTILVTLPGSCVSFQGPEALGTGTTQYLLCMTMAGLV